jgi:hypothetical protein
VDFRLVAIFRDAGKSRGNERAKVVSTVALSTTLKTRRVALPVRSETVAADSLPLQKPQTKQLRELSWRAFVVRQNLSNRRRKVIDAGTRHDDAVAATVSFLGDAQESPALVLPELHVEMLALNLQFSRLDDVIHFPLKPPTLPHSFWGMEEKSSPLRKFLGSAKGGRQWQDLWIEVFPSTDTTGGRDGRFHFHVANGFRLEVKDVVTENDHVSEFARRN